MLFLDPDNGIEVPSTKYGASGSSKCVYWSELKDTYENGHSILVYQHFPHENRERFVQRRACRLRDELRASDVIAFSTSYVVFFLVQQPRHVSAFANAAHEVQQQWRSQIGVWPAATAGGVS